MTTEELLSRYARGWDTYSHTTTTSNSWSRTYTVPNFNDIVSQSTYSWEHPAYETVYTYNTPSASYDRPKKQSPKPEPEPEPCTEEELEEFVRGKEQEA